MNISPIKSNQKHQTFGVKGVEFKRGEQLLDSERFDNIFPEIERKKVTGLEHIKPRTGEDIFVNVDYLEGTGDEGKNKITLIFTEAQDALSNLSPEKIFPQPKEEVILHSAWGKLNARGYKEILDRLAKKITHYRNSSLALQVT